MTVERQKDNNTIAFIYKIAILLTLLRNALYYFQKPKNRIIYNSASTEEVIDLQNMWS